MTGLRRWTALAGVVLAVTAWAGSLPAQSTPSAAHVRTTEPAAASVVFRRPDPLPSLEAPMGVLTAAGQEPPPSPFPGAERYALVGGIAGFAVGAATGFARCESPETATCVGQAAIRGIVFGALGYVAGYVVGAVVVTAR